jgi:Mitochondrial carrier protein
MKVRLQTSQVTSGGFKSTFLEFGGISSLFRGMSAPLGTAAAVNAIIFGSYGLSSRIYNDYYSMDIQTTYDEDDDNIPTHDPWKKSMICGSFAGLMQAFIICPMEHVKCRLQTQHHNHHQSENFTGSFQATKTILKEHGIQRLFQGWWSTLWREVPAFGIYFASYDYMKDIANDFLAKNMNVRHQSSSSSASNNNEFAYTKNKSDHSHTWLASAFAGGCAGCLTWIIIYPFDVIKTRVQTSPLTTPFRELTMYRIGSNIVQQHGYTYLFRGLGITLIRAFPVNGTIFPVYEFTLKQVRTFTDSR